MTGRRTLLWAAALTCSGARTASSPEMAKPLPAQPPPPWRLTTGKFHFTQYDRQLYQQRSGGFGQDLAGEMTRAIKARG